MSLKSLYLRKRFWISDFFNGSKIGKPYREIKSILENKGSEEKRKILLKGILTYATNHSAFYSDYDPLDLQNFPVMNKKSLIENSNHIRVKESDIPGQTGEVFIQRTSGSTGTPLAVPQDTLKRLRRIADLKYFNQIVGFKSHEPLIHLRIWNQWQKKSDKQIRRDNIYPFDCANLSNDRLKELCELIKSTKCVAIRGYASSIDLLAKYIKNHPEYKFPHLKICIAGSEALGDDTRSNVKKYLGCEVISQYADEECGILAQERIPTKDRDNIMYLNHADYYFEFLKLDKDEPADYGELSRIVITDLHNHAFPIIRYDCGDVGIQLPPDKYSNGYPVLGKLYGRRMDICFTTKGEPFSPMTLARTVKYFDKIVQWQFIQNSKTDYVLMLVLNDCDDVETYMSPAVNELKNVLGHDANIMLKQVDEIPCLKSGKRKTVINNWNNL